jgi:hypothetical protein
MDEGSEGGTEGESDEGEKLGQEKTAGV